MPPASRPTSPRSTPTGRTIGGSSTLRRLVAALSAATVAVTAAVALTAGGSAQAATVIHVSPSGSDSANGSQGAPVRTVKRAVQLAASGDTVQIASGTYHEEVQVYSKTVHLTAAPGATVVFDGSTPVGGWTASGGDWYSAWQTDFERAGAPHTRAERPEAGWPEQFFLDGVGLTEVTSRNAVVPGTFYNDRAADRVWIGDNPAGRNIAGSDLAWGIYLNHAHGSSVTGITIRRYATPTRNMAAVRAYADNLTLTDLTVDDNAFMGVSAMGSNITIDQLTARRNGYMGAHGHLATGLTITNATLIGNNSEGFDAFHAAAGVKVTETTGYTITDSTVIGNDGPGIWTDLATSDVTVANNLVTDNARSGIEIELSFNVRVVGNVSTNNGETGIWILESRDSEVWHNAAFHNFRDLWIEEGPRSEVYNVSVVNNTFGGGTAGGPAILNVDDWTGERGAQDMDITLSGNRYWLPAGSPTPHLSRWANWPSPLSLSASLAAHQGATGGDADAAFSNAASNPYVRDPGAGDYRQPAGATGGQALGPVIAAALGAAAGGSHPAGPLFVLDGASPRSPDNPLPPNPLPPNPTSSNPEPTTPPAPVRADVLPVASASDVPAVRSPAPTPPTTTPQNAVVAATLGSEVTVTTSVSPLQTQQVWGWYSLTQVVADVG